MYNVVATNQFITCKSQNKVLAKKIVYSIGIILERREKVKQPKVQEGKKSRKKKRRRKNNSRSGRIFTLHTNTSTVIMTLFALVFKHIYQFQSLAQKVLTVLKVELVGCAELIRSLECHIFSQIELREVGKILMVCILLL